MRMPEGTESVQKAPPKETESVQSVPPKGIKSMQSASFYNNNESQ